MFYYEGFTCLVGTDAWIESNAEPENNLRF